MAFIRIFRIIVVVPLFFLILNCSGGAGEGLVNLPVPFAGALTSDSRVVVVDGMPVSSGVEFAAFDSQGNNIGSCSFVEEAMSASVIQGIETLFTMPLCCQIDEVDEVCADSVQFVELAYRDPTIDICALLPELERTQGVENCGARLVRGAASGRMTRGEGSFAFAASLGLTIEHRYAAVVKGENLDRRALNQIEGVFILHR